MAFAIRKSCLPCPQIVVPLAQRMFNGSEVIRKEAGSFGFLCYSSSLAGGGGASFVVTICSPILYPPPVFRSSMGSAACHRILFKRAFNTRCIIIIFQDRGCHSRQVRTDSQPDNFEWRRGRRGGSESNTIPRICMAWRDTPSSSPVWR